MIAVRKEKVNRWVNLLAKYYQKFESPQKTNKKVIYNMLPFFLFGLVSSARYAILFAGSNEFYNYRHQADIYTIYNVLLKRGFSPKEIFLFAYDDIATSSDNPFPGQVFHTLDHKVNQYPGSDAINYRGDAVNSGSLYNIFASCPSTTEDNVFIYYDNHGGPGILGCPLFWDFILYPDLVKALNTLTHKYALFCIEACYAGSVAEHFNTTRLATITASNDQESSYACAYDSTLATYLSNEFTSNFLDSTSNKPTELIDELFDYCQFMTASSHVMYYGDESIKQMTIDQFIGTPTESLQNSGFISNGVTEKASPKQATEKTLTAIAQNHEKPTVRARARLELLRKQTQTKKLETSLELIARYVDSSNVKNIMNLKSKDPLSLEYIDVLKYFVQKFGEVNPDDFGQFAVLKNLAARYPKSQIIQAIDEVL